MPGDDWHAILEHPEEGFIYLRYKDVPKKGLDFEGYTVPGTDVGRWIIVDIGDLDGDGRTGRKALPLSY